jgi:hypothetical protein
VWGHGFSEAVTRKSFLGPDSGVAVLVKPLPESPFLGPESGNSNILLLLFSCTNKRTCGDMQDR